MERYTYLCLGLILTLLGGILLWRRRDLAKLAAVTGAIGLVLGPIAEFWYFQDYWRPPSLQGIAQVSLEDALFGWSVGVLCVTLYPVLWRRMPRGAGLPTRIPDMIALAAFGVAWLLVGVHVLHINSIFVSSSGFLAITAYMLWRRPDLWRISLITGGVLAALIIPIYLLLFGWLSPGFEHFWLLDGTPAGTKILGHIPLTELLWYFAWGSYEGIAYLFLLGWQIKPIHQHETIANPGDQMVR